MRDAGPCGALMRHFGLSRLLQIVVMLPLLVLLAFGSMLVLETLSGYREVERLAALEQFVSAASRLTSTWLNQEATVTSAFVASGTQAQRTEMLLARRRSDEAILAFKSGAASAGLSDPNALAIIKDIESRLGGLEGSA